MQSNLKQFASGELVDMLMKNTEYYLTLSGIDAESNQRKLSRKHIDLIILEIKTREGFKQALEDKDPGIANL